MKFYLSLMVLGLTAFVSSAVAVGTLPENASPEEALEYYRNLGIERGYDVELESKGVYFSLGRFNGPGSRPGDAGPGTDPEEEEEPIDNEPPGGGYTPGSGEPASSGSGAGTGSLFPDSGSGSGVAGSGVGSGASTGSGGGGSSGGSGDQGSGGSGSDNGGGGIVGGGNGSSGSGTGSGTGSAALCASLLSELQAAKLSGGYSSEVDGKSCKENEGIFGSAQFSEYNPCPGPGGGNQRVFDEEGNIMWSLGTPASTGILYWILGPIPDGTQVEDPSGNWMRIFSDWTANTRDSSLHSMLEDGTVGKYAVSCITCDGGNIADENDLLGSCCVAVSGALAW